MAVRGITAAIVLSAVASVHATSSEDKVMARGDYLVNTIVACGNCHTEQTPNGPNAQMRLAGTFLIEEPAFKAYAPNITPDKETGIGHYSKADLIRAIRDGIRPDGTLIGPPMPFAMYRGDENASDWPDVDDKLGEWSLLYL